MMGKSRILKIEKREIQRTLLFHAFRSVYIPILWSYPK